MGHAYKSVQWNANKIAYDLVALGGLAIFIGLFMLVGLQPHASGHAADPVVLLIRALGAASFLMLTIILMIGPLARMSNRFLPFLYNRRHLGVMTAFVAAAHFGLSLMWYHGGGPLNPFVSLMVSGLPGDPFPGFPFEIFGLGAFAILAVMAATSHDFWLNNLSAGVWKALHMLVYVAYGLIVLHVAWGALVTESSPALSWAVYGAAALVAGLHIAAGAREWGRDNRMKGAKAGEGGWLEIGDPVAAPDGRALIAPLPKGDRVAIFRRGDRLHALANACAHQAGPLGEGCLKDGLVTCPWHGWQYRLEDGVSPPPYTERVATHDLKLDGGRLFVRIRPNALGAKGAFVDLAARETAP